MKRQAFPLADESPARLELRWEGLQAQVWFDGVHVTTLEGAAGLKEGWSAQLEDGRRLEVRTVRRTAFPELSVMIDGWHVPSSPSHPEKMLRTSANTMLGVSAFLIVTGAGRLWNYNWLDALFGLFYLIGALLLRQRRRLGAAVIAIPLFLSLDFLALAVFMGQVDRAWVIRLAMNLLFVIFVVRAYQSARDSRAYRLRTTSMSARERGSTSNVAS
jgi:hypothetical protein